jgi:hypothetical protein
VEAETQPSATTALHGGCSPVAKGGAGEVLQQRKIEGEVRCMKWQRQSASVWRSLER